MRILAVFIFTFISTCLIGQDRLEVGLKNGKVIYPRTILYKSGLFNSGSLILDGDEKIDISSVAYYQTSADFFRIESIGGGLSFTKDAKLRRVENGAIQVYEYTFTRTNGGGTGVNGFYMAPTYSTVTQYYSPDTSDRMQLIDDNLLASLVRGDAKSLDKLKSRKRRKLQNVGFYVLGGAITLIGTINWLSQVNEETNTPGVNNEDTSLNLPPSILIGVAIMWIPTIRNWVSTKGDNTLEVIVDYNSRH